MLNNGVQFELNRILQIFSPVLVQINCAYQCQNSHRVGGSAYLVPCHHSNAQLGLRRNILIQKATTHLLVNEFVRFQISATDGLICASLSMHQRQDTFSHTGTPIQRKPDQFDLLMRGLEFLPWRKRF